MRIYVLLASIALASALAGCVVEPQRMHQRRYDTAPPAPRMAELIVYPARGQTAEQTDRDRYECHTWAVRETRFDPSRVAPAQYLPPRERAEAPPPGAGTALGAVTGAVLGAIIAPHGDEGGGAAVGAIAGALVGNASERAQADAAREDAGRYDNPVAARQAGDGAGAYRRAISACLEARGYTVR
jgi:hypothetical protein